MSEEKINSNSIMVGKKPIMSYAKALSIQLKEGNSEVNIRARGKFISKAVDVAELATKRLLKNHNLSVKDIKIDTESFEHEGKQINVSTIDLKIGKVN